MRRDPEQDWLPHCVTCDGRHNPQEQTCEQFADQRRRIEAHWARKDWKAAVAEGSSSPAVNLEEGANLRGQRRNPHPPVG